MYDISDVIIIFLRYIQKNQKKTVKLKRRYKTKGKSSKHRQNTFLASLKGKKKIQYKFSFRFNNNNEKIAYSKIPKKTYILDSSERCGDTTKFYCYCCCCCNKRARACSFFIIIREIIIIFLCFFL